MGISEKIEKVATEKERERGIIGIERLFNYLKNFEIGGLNEVLIEINDLRGSKFYEELIKAVTANRLVKENRKFTFEEGLKVRLLRAAKGTLPFGGLLTNIFSSSLISLRDIALVHVYLESIYYVEKGKLKRSDSLNIYFSGLDERIVFALNKFDGVELEDLPEPTPEYFQMLKEVKWKNKEVKNVYTALTELMQDIILIKCINKFSEYKAVEDLFIQTIAGCSAVNDGRLEIEAEDVVKAYKTFFKLINTDVTKYKAIPESLQSIDAYGRNTKNEGYLVCESCGGYYKLKEGESPNDFSKCQCGGELEFREEL